MRSSNPEENLNTVVEQCFIPLELPARKSTTQLVADALAGSSYELAQKEQPYAYEIIDRAFRQASGRVSFISQGELSGILVQHYSKPCFVEETLLDVFRKYFRPEAEPRKVTYFCEV